MSAEQGPIITKNLLLFPVMTSLISKAIKNIENGNNCFIADSSQDIADKCINLISNEDLRNAIAQEGFQLVDELYSWDKCLEGYEIL